MRRIDLNLLYVLCELLKEPNTTKVGEKLGLTQSAVSASLGRLRWAFQDDLFVRSGRAMVPTKRAEGLLEPVEEIIQRIESLVEEVYFEPERLQRKFTIATTDFLLQWIAAPIIAAIQPIAPNSRLIFSPFAPDTRDRIRSGHLDLMLAPFVDPLISEPLVSAQALYKDRLVVATWTGNEQYKDRVSEDQLVKATHLVFNPTMVGSWKSTAQTLIEERGLQLRSIAEFTSMNTLIYALRGNNVLAIMPKKLIDVFGRDADVKALELPYEAPEFEVGLIWNRSHDNDPEHQWFRGEVDKALSKTPFQPHATAGSARRQR